MIALFQKNIYLVTIAIILYTIVLNISIFFNPSAYIINETDTYLARSIFNGIKNRTTQGYLKIILLIIHFLIINRAVVKHRINKAAGLLVGACYVLCAALIPIDSSSLTPALISQTFILLSLSKILAVYNKREISETTFLSGFYGGVAALIYFPFIYFFIITTVAIIIMRSFSMIERLQHFLGWLIPFILLAVWQFVFEVEALKVTELFNGKMNFLDFKKADFTIGQWLGLASLIALVVISVVSYSAYTSKRDIATVKRINIMYWVLLYAGVSAMIFSGITANHLILLTLPCSYFLASSLSSLKQPLIAELIHLVLLGVAFYMQFS